MSCDKIEFLNEFSEEYEAFVQKSTTGHLFQSYYWHLVKNNWKWDVLILRDDKGIRASLAVLTRKVPMTPYTMMYAPRGPVFRDEGDYEALELLKDGIKKLGKTNKAYVLKVDPDIPDSDEKFISAMKKIGFRQLPEALAFEHIQAQHVVRLNIKDKTEEEILASFKSKTRYNVRLAMRHGVEAVRCGREKIDDFYNLMKATGERDGFVIRSKEYLLRIYDSLGEHASMIIAYHDGVPLAGGIFGSYGPVALYLYGASSNENRNLMGPYLMQWEAIRFAKERGAEIYDFRGVPKNGEENEHVGGLYRFKIGFCPEVTHFCGEFDYVFKPLVYKMVDVLTPLWKKLRNLLAKLRK